MEDYFALCRFPYGACPARGTLIWCASYLISYHKEWVVAAGLVICLYAYIKFKMNKKTAEAAARVTDFPMADPRTQYQLADLTEFRALVQTVCSRLIHAGNFPTLGMQDYMDAYGNWHDAQYNRLREELGWRKLSKLNLVIIQKAFNGLKSDAPREDCKALLIDMLNKNPALKVNVKIDNEETEEKRVLTEVKFKYCMKFPKAGGSIRFCGGIEYRHEGGKDPLLSAEQRKRNYLIAKINRLNPASEFAHFTPHCPDILLRQIVLLKA